MIELIHIYFFTLVIATLLLVEAQARWYPPKYLRGGIPDKLGTISNPYKLENLKILRMFPEHAMKMSLALRHHPYSTYHNPEYIIGDNDLKGTFNKMLETVVKVNDDRIDSLKKFFELQNYLPQVSRTTHERNPIIAYITMNIPKYNSKYKNLNINHMRDSQYIVVEKEIYKDRDIRDNWKDIKEAEYSDEDDDENSIFTSKENEDFYYANNYYLRNWKGCNKSASKACVKACKKAFKEVCREYMCSKSIKKAGKKLCKKRCKSEFENDSKKTDDDDY